MIALLLWMGCEEPPTPSPTYQTTKQDTGISDTGSSDTGDTSVEDTAETYANPLPRCYALFSVCR